MCERAVPPAAAVIAQHAHPTAAAAATGVGALAPVADQVRVASQAGESIAHAVAATSSEIDEIFDDVQGRLLKKALGFWSQVVR